MTFSFATKLHLLLILVIIAIGLYMFMLYKEVKVFQDELVSMKSQLKAATTAAAAVAIRVVAAAPPEEGEPAVLPVIIEEEDDVEPDQSVTSKEIKDLLSSIQKDGEVEAEVEPEPEPEAEQEAEPDYSTMTPEELKHVKYETLKSYLKSKGHHIKGTKADMIKRIGELFYS